MRFFMLTVAAFGFAPLAAEAVPIGDGFVTVYYEGTINLVEGPSVGSPCPTCPYALGDRVSGTLLIDLSLAPPDAEPDAKGLGVYETTAATERAHPSFVRGYAPDRGYTSDRVDVIDGDPTRPGQHFYGVTDSQQAVFSDNGRRYTAWNYLHLTADSTELDFLHGEGLVQDFSLTQRPDVIAGGAIQFGRTWIDDLQSGIQGVMGFALTRLTVRPGRCSIEHD